MIWENLNEKLVLRNLDVKSSDEVFEAMGGSLEKAGYCRDTYVKALKDREVEFPTGVQIGEIGVAIPHTDPCYVDKTAIAIATLKNPVSFYHMGTSPEDGMEVKVQFVIMLAIAGNRHLEVLQAAIQLIQDVEVLGKLLAAEDVNEIIELIKNKEEQ